jgi:predicted glutamine amidotransferase
MCLIIHSRTGALPAKADFWSAAKDNPDGIGIMSADGIEKFLGKKSTRKAWKYLQDVAALGIPFGVHFRWATHGEVNRSNAHPFAIPDVGAYLMHNGILWTSSEATAKESDTAVFARRYMPTFGNIRAEGWRETVSNVAGAGNKLLVMSEDGVHFEIINERAGTWISADLWFSNTYSLASQPKWEMHGYDQRGRWVYDYASDDTELDWQDYDRVAAAAAGWPSGPTMDPDYDSDRKYWRDTMMHRETDTSKVLASAVKGRAYPVKAKSGFDWHNSETWTKYPIPGTEHRSAVKRRAFGDGEAPDPLAQEEQRTREELDRQDYLHVHGVDPYV